MSKLFIYLLLGGAIGAALGYFGQCTSGTCPLTANWKRGLLVGAGLGLAFFFSGGGLSAGTVNASTEHVRKISAAEFETEVLGASGPVVVDFYAPWCGPCRRLAPRLDKAASQMSGQVKVVKLNVDEAPELARKYNIRGIPALKFFRGGQEVGEVVGLLSQDQLLARMQELASAPPKPS